MSVVGQHNLSGVIRVGLTESRVNIQFNNQIGKLLRIQGEVIRNFTGIMGEN